jgi:hypothetical protein
MSPSAYPIDDVFRHYRMDTRRREPKFIGFAIQDDNIEVKNRKETQIFYTHDS